jgi:dUTP pyrophosphatase
MLKLLKVSKVRDVKDPQRGTPGSAGIDLFIPNDYAGVAIAPQGSVLIPSGIKAKVPDGYALVAMNKSGVATKLGLVVGACVVDSDYQGEIHIHMINVSNRCVNLEPGQKIVQFLLLPVEHCGISIVPPEQLFDSTTTRGAGGFGSTGV